MPPSSAAAVSSPAARPRLPVGNSSVRYTASAGNVIAADDAARNTDNHIGGPADGVRHDDERGAVGTPTAMMWRGRGCRRRARR